MGKSVLEGNDLIITEIPAYASNIIYSEKSNGLGGEIIVSKEFINFFGVTGNEITIKGKTCMELNSNNRYMFDKDNLISYMEQVKSEYVCNALFKYKEFKSEAWKNVDIFGWEKRKKKIKSSTYSKKFNLYMKKTNDKDESKSPRYYIAGTDSELYSIVIKYCIIPEYTNIRVVKTNNSTGGCNYTFLLEAQSLDNLQEIIEAQHATDETKLSVKSKEELFDSAREKSNTAEKNQEGTTVTTKIYKRDSAVAAYVKKRADGKCDLCGKEAPFKDKKGLPFLEEHHVERLADGGKDSIDNAVALCPNCHRQIHVACTDEIMSGLMERLLAYAEIEKIFLGQND